MKNAITSLIAGLFIICPLFTLAVTNTANTSGAWETGTNWSQGHAPLATEDVLVPGGMAMTINAADVCLSLTINGTGSVTINAANSLSIAGSFSNAGTFTAANIGSTLTFNAASNSTVTGAGTFTIAGTIVLNMSAAATALDVQSSSFITGINTGGNYYFTFTRGTFRMDNAGTLNDCYNSGSTNAITIPFGVVIESDNGTMNLAKNGTMATIGDGISTYGQSNIVLSGKLFINGGTVDVAYGQTISNNSAQTLNMGVDLQYHVNGGTPQLYVSSGTLNLGSGFNYYTNTDYVDFHMTGGTILAAAIGSTYMGTFQLNDVVGGKTFMSGGLVELTDASWGNYPDADLGGSNVAATQYSVTGGTIQFGSPLSANAGTYFAFEAYSTTNYPNFDFESGLTKVVQPLNNSDFRMYSLTSNANMTFNVADYFTGNSTKNVTIDGNNGTWAFDDEGGFIQGTCTLLFTGAVNQLINSASLTNDAFYNVTIANTGLAITSVGGTLTTLNIAGNLLESSGVFSAGTMTTLNVTGNVTLNGGTLASPNSINVAGNWTDNGGVFNGVTGTVIFDGSVAQTISGPTSTTFKNLTINNSSGTTNGVTQGVNTNVSGTLTLSNGTYFLNGHTLTIQNNVNSSIAGGSTSSYIVSENTSMTSLITWHNISKTVASYVFPFGVNISGTDYYLPFTFNITGAAATLGDVSLATYHTGSNNTPFAPGATEMNGSPSSCYPGVDETVQAIIDRWWQITAATSPTATITFSYPGDEASTVSGAGGPCGSTIDAYHWNAGVAGWDNPVGNQTLIVTTTGSVGTVTASGISTFSPWVLGLYGSPLPIKLLTFTATYDNTENIVNLNWSTATEVNNKLFTIERTMDGVNYTEIATLPGAGNSNHTLNYTTIDPNPIPGVDYYRLKQTDYDGTFSYSDVVPVNVTSSEVLTLFPNPVTTSNLMLSYYVPATSAVDIRIVDLAGQEMAAYSTTMEKGNNTFTIDASKFAGGVYILKAVIGNQTFVRKFVKQ